MVFLEDYFEYNVFSSLKCFRLGDQWKVKNKFVVE